MSFKISINDTNYLFRATSNGSDVNSYKKSILKKIDKYYFTFYILYNICIYIV